MINPPQEKTQTRWANGRLKMAAECHNMPGVSKALRDGADINSIDEFNGLAALHIAIGNNDIELTRFLVEKCGAKFFPDGFGRWPTLIAAECRVSNELSDYVLAKEAEWIAAHPS